MEDEGKKSLAAFRRDDRNFLFAVKVPINGEKKRNMKEIKNNEEKEDNFNQCTIAIGMIV